MSKEANGIVRCFFPQSGTEVLSILFDLGGMGGWVPPPHPLWGGDLGRVGPPGGIFFVFLAQSTQNDFRPRKVEWVPLSPPPGCVGVQTPPGSKKTSALDVCTRGGGVGELWSIRPPPLTAILCPGDTSEESFTFRRAIRDLASDAYSPLSEPPSMSTTGTLDHRSRRRSALARGGPTCRSHPPPCNIGTLWEPYRFGD